MEFQPTDKVKDLLERVTKFMDDHVYPAEPTYAEQRRTLTEQGTPHHLPPVVEELKDVARWQGLWNLFLPESTDPAHGLTVADYAHIAEVTGRSIEIAPEAMNCSAPDTGNMEVLQMCIRDSSNRC